MTYFSKDLGETALKELLAQFEAETGITVNFVDVGHEDFKTGILIQLAGGNPPDVSHRLGRCAHRVPGPERLAGTHRRDVGRQRPRQPVPAAASIDSAATYDGAQVPAAVRLPLSRGMFYNPKIFADAGVADPDDLGRAEGRL